MELCIDKCANTTLQKGKLKTSHSVVLDVDTVVKEMEPEQTYKKWGPWHSTGKNKNEVQKGML